MDLGEPRRTAVLLGVLGILLGASALLSRTTRRTGIPTPLIFIGIGLCAGREGLRLVQLHDVGTAFRVGTIALALILFDGGLNTPVRALRRTLAPASVLATAGVVGTMLLTALVARPLGMPWPQAILLGAIVSATDAAAVFSVLRQGGIQLRERVASTLELESALNDPTAAILTLSITGAIVAGSRLSWLPFAEGGLQVVVGLAGGLAFGYGGRLLLRRYPLPAGGLYPVVSLALAFLAFAVPTLLGGSGLLGVYVAGILIGNQVVRYQAGLRRVHDALAWLAQVTVFLMLGLLVLPSDLVAVAGPGLGLAAFVTFVVRPAVVAACALPFGYRPREVVYMGIVGLRGAVPVIFATFPLLAGVNGGARLFNMVFFIVVANALVPGTLVRWLTARLGLTSGAPPLPPAELELTSTQLLEGELLSFYIDARAAVAGARVSDLPFPESAAATLVIRGKKLIAPKGDTQLLAGDHVYVFCQPQDLPMVQLMFGPPEEAAHAP